MKSGLCFSMLLCCLQLLFTPVQAQSEPVLYGKVLTSDGQPVKDVAVVILETRQQTVTANDGSYKFEHVKNGTYTVKALVLGLPAMKKTITVTRGAGASADFTLSESAVGLQILPMRGSVTPFLPENCAVLVWALVATM